MANKAGIRKLSRGKETAAKAPVPKPGRSTKDAGKDQKRESELVALVRVSINEKKIIDTANLNLDEHLKQRGFTKAEERKPRPVKELLEIFLREIKEGWWVDAIWIWRNGINRAEIEILRKEIYKRMVK
jgi:hypothetical protein